MRSLKLFIYLMATVCPFVMSAQADEIVAHKKFELGDYDSAIESYREVLDANPNNQEVIIRMAGSLRMTGRMRFLLNIIFYHY